MKKKKLNLSDVLLIAATATVLGAVFYIVKGDLDLTILALAGALCFIVTYTALELKKSMMVKR